MNKKINLVTAGQIRTDLPEFHVGDTVNISVNVIEGDKERVQIFKGIVMGIKGSGINKTFRVRKISNGVGVERIFPINSPRIAKIEIVKHGSVRRAKLYYLRGLTGKAATKIKEKKRVVKATAPVVEEKAAPVKEVAAEVETAKEELVS
jgi:large subunit ribosomal protein L19